MNSTLRIRSAETLPSVAMALLAFAATGASAQSDAVLTLNIEPQNAGLALMTLSRTSGVQIMLKKEAGSRIEVEGLKGEYRFEEALAALLADTGLTYEYASENVVLVQEAPDTEEDEAADGETAPAEEEEPIELERQVVTGTRLPAGDASARVYSLTAREIAARGVSTVEELMRTLPWNFPSITTQTNMLWGAGATDTDKNLGPLGLGISTVNLRSMGSANTLVLLNGRRVAGVAGDEDNIVNLLNVPLSAIERIDIQLDGASAVYGADAIGGVVNFITRKNYRGVSVTVRNEFSSTDADKSHSSIQGGYSWGSGDVTATVSRDTSKPINNYKLWTTSDYRGIFGPEFDARRRNIGQPGVVQAICRLFTLTYPCGPKIQLPAGHSGVDATIADFTGEIMPWDYIGPHNGEDSTNTSLSVYLEQDLTSNFSIYADALYSDHESYQRASSDMRGYVVPASNAFSPFGTDVAVSYSALAEIEAGLIPSPYTESASKQRNYSAGFSWDIMDDHQLEFNFTRSKSTRRAWQLTLHWGRSKYDPARDRLLSAVASPDPDVALNLFGDGSAQSPELGALFSDAFGPRRGVSIQTVYEPLLRGELFRLWGGPVDYAIGAEFREDVSYRIRTRYAEDGTLSDDIGKEVSVGVKEPTRDSAAYFAELAVPIVGAGNARPGLRSLILSLQARHDRYKSSGADGGVETAFVGGAFVNVGEPDLTSVKYSATSPRIGFQYQPSDGLIARAAWSKSFRPPVFSDTFDISEPIVANNFFAEDPYDPDGPSFRFMTTIFAFNNPDIKPEFSNNYSIGFDWTPLSIPGLRWTVDWSRIDFENKIESASALILNYPEIAFRLPQIVERDAEGRAVLVNQTLVNVAEKISEILDAQLEYRFSTAWGVFTPRLAYARVLDEFFRVAPDSDPVTRVGTVRGSDKYKLVGSLNWVADKFTADVFVRYTPSYVNDRTGGCEEVVGRCGRVSQSRPPLEVDSYVTVDLTLAYRFDNGLRLRAGGRNVFDAEPPKTVWEVLSYDPTRYDARGQVLFLEVNWEM